MDGDSGGGIRGRSSGKASKVAEQGGSTASMEEKVEELTGLVRELYPSTRFGRTDIRTVVEEAYKVADVIFGEEEAIRWGEGFEWPAEVFKRDDALAEACGFDLEAMARKRMEEMLPDRLNDARVRAMVPPDDPDFDRLLDLVEGMRVMTGDDYAPSGSPPPMREIYLKLKNAVNKMLLSLWDDKLAFVMTKEAVQRCGPVGFSATSWAPKSQKASGRYIFDSSDDSHGPSLNSDQAREKLREFYGYIEHPNIDELIGMVLEYVKDMQVELGDEFDWEEVVLWKADLSKAFTLLFFEPGGVRYLACELTDDLVLIYYCGCFGWTGTPFAFQVITRVLTRLINAHVKGRAKMYVDDVMGCTLLRYLDYDKRITSAICEGLLGSKAMALDKWAEGRRLPLIGWDVDLDKRCVTLARKNFAATFYGFFTVDCTKYVQVKTLMRLSSWAARYCTILRVMRPFTSSLYAEHTGMHNTLAYKPISIEGTVAILMWRVVLCLLHLDEDTYARSFDSFISRDGAPPHVRFEFDASLEGISIGISDLQDPRGERVVGIGCMRLPYHMEESKWMNVNEFTAVTVGLICLAQQGYRGVDILLVGDNKTALEWGSSEHFRTKLGFSVTLLYVLLCVAFDFRVVAKEHISSEDNWFYDQLSRDAAPEDLGVPPMLILDLEGNFVAQQLIWGANPTREITSVGEFMEMWRTYASYIAALRGDN